MNYKLLLVVPILFSTLVFADGIDVDGIYRKELAINQGTEALLKYRIVRDRFANDEEVTAKSIKQIQESLKNWVTVYSKLRSEANQTTDLLDLDSKVRTALRGQASERARIVGDIEKVRSTIQQNMALISDFTNLPSSPEVEKNINVIKSNAVSLGKHLNLLGQNLKFADQQMSRLSTAFPAEFFSARYKALAIAKGLDAAGPEVTKFSEFIKAEIFSAPILEDLNHKILDASLMMANLEGEHLTQIMPKLKEQCKSSHDIIVNSDSKETNKQELLNKVDAKCKKLEEDYSNTILVYTPAKLASSMHSMKIKKYRNACSSENERCLTYRRLTSIELAKVSSYSKVQISALETMWAELEVTR